MSENDVAQKLEKLRLIMNHPEPALICSRCKYALQPSGVRVSRYLAERHNVPASDRTELVTYVDSLRLPNPNLLNGRNDSNVTVGEFGQLGISATTQAGPRLRSVCCIEPKA
jgi:hypothetical protein